MSSYVRSIRHEVPFDGQQVVVTLKPLEFGDLMKLRGAMPASPKTITVRGPDGEEVEVIDMGPEYMLLASQLLTRYVERIEGLADAAGTAVAVDEVCRVAFFAPLVFSCVNHLIATATPPNPSKSGRGSTATLPDVAASSTALASAA